MRQNSKHFIKLYVSKKDRHQMQKCHCLRGKGGWESGMGNKRENK